MGSAAVMVLGVINLFGDRGRWRRPRRRRLSTEPAWPDGRRPACPARDRQHQCRGRPAGRRIWRARPGSWPMRQTAARGRRGRAWAMPEGNFAATLVLRPPERPEQVALRSFVAALALFDAFAAATGRPSSFALKWPNDVLLNGGKVAGILLESAGQGGGGRPSRHRHRRQPRRRARRRPGRARRAAPGQPAGRDRQPGRRPRSSSTCWPPPMPRARRSSPPTGSRRSATPGCTAPPGWARRITARTGGATSRPARFETVDAAGNLVLSTAEGRRAIPAADVFF